MKKAVEQIEPEEKCYFCGEVIDDEEKHGLGVCVEPSY